MQDACSGCEFEQLKQDLYTANQRILLLEAHVMMLTESRRRQDETAKNMIASMNGNAKTLEKLLSDLKYYVPDIKFRTKEIKVFIP